MRHSFVLTMANNTDVLTRVVGLLRRHGVDLESLVYGPTPDPGVSRLEAVVRGEGALELIRLQLMKQIEVFSAELSAVPAVAVGSAS